MRVDDWRAPTGNGRRFLFAQKFSGFDSGAFELATLMKLWQEIQQARIVKYEPVCANISMK